MQFQTAEEVENICKLLSVVTKCCRKKKKKTPNVSLSRKVTALFYFKPFLRVRQLSHTKLY